MKINLNIIKSLNKFIIGNFKADLTFLSTVNKKNICIAFYPDNSQILSRITNNFFKNEKISISQSNINLIINKCNGDRGILKMKTTTIYKSFEHKSLSMGIM